MGFAPLYAQTVTALQLRNAITDNVIRELTEGDVIDLRLDGEDLAISADAAGVGSVRFVLSGAESLTRTESAAPYALHGDASGDYNIWNPSLGNYTLSATAYSGAGASGTAGPEYIVNFSVINTTVSLPDGGLQFIEEAGLVVMECESQPLVGFWDLNTTLTGYAGAGYIEWKTGDPFTGAIAAGTDIITYDVIINNPGRYRMQIRSAAPERNEHNDVWVAFPDNGALREKAGVYTSLGTGFFKVYQNVDNDTWTWNSSTVDGNAHNIYTDFNAPGVYRFQFSGRSTQFKIDRIVLYGPDVPSYFANSLSRPESQRNNVAIVADLDSTDQDQAVTIAVLANDLTNYSYLDTASVAEVLAPANGSLVIEANGSITYTPNPGFYGVDSFQYMVCNAFDACGMATVTVLVQENIIEPPVCDVPVNLTATILSPNAATLSWDPVLNADGYQFQGRRIGSGWRNRSTTGTSITFSIFSPGDSYEFRVRAFCNGDLVNPSGYGGPQGFTMPLARENAVATPIHVGPNPTSDFLQISGLSADENTIQLTDISGRAVGQWMIAEQGMLDVQSVEAGMYFITIRENGQLLHTQTMLITR